MAKGRPEAENIPKVGDLASVAIGTDVYPCKINYVSYAGSKLRLDSLASGAKKNDDGTPGGELEVHTDQIEQKDAYTANYSAKKGQFMVGDHPVRIGAARSYRDPSF